MSEVIFRRVTDNLRIANGNAFVQVIDACRNQMWRELACFEIIACLQDLIAVIRSVQFNMNRRLIVEADRDSLQDQIRMNNVRIVIRPNHKSLHLAQVILNRVLEFPFIPGRVKLVPADDPDLVVRRNPCDEIGFLVHDIAHFKPFLSQNRNEQFIDIRVESFFRVEQPDENAHVIERAIAAESCVNWILMLIVLESMLENTDFPCEVAVEVIQIRLVFISIGMLIELKQEI